MNYQIDPKTNRNKSLAKRHKVMATIDKPDVVGRIERNLLKGYELRINYIKNTTSVSSCDMEQVTPTKYPNQKYL